MKQYKITSYNLDETASDDCYLDPNDPIQELMAVKYLAGLGNQAKLQEYKGINISNTGNENAKIMRERNIKPGTPEWFKLWFSLPYMTGEKKI